MKRTVLLSLCLLTLVSCAPQVEETRNYDEYEENHLTSLDEFFSLDYDFYFIELYQIDCPHCIGTKTTIFNYLDKQNNEGVEIPLFLFDMNEGNRQENRNKFKMKPENYNYEVLVREMENDKPSTLEDTYFIGTPTIYEIVDHKVNKVYVGINEVNGVLNSQN